ncbi:hypothetical protein [Streptomyces xantholiticus]|uniref:hypothetical protein n=1 Tax=Streptomyces xantholiticus TaxID=68285 RepID=UPI001677FD07|nr:hypothetical protein [Streptomyces xantholiticus]GGW41388.1 hypothetical protein GCM10010381_27820 [Streptomyces xantholiticus]
MPVPDARVEFLIGGEWVDVTDDVRAAGTQITHTRGYREGGTRVDPAAADFTVASPGGKYSNRNPRSEYFGLLPRNTPARCTVAGPTYLSMTSDSSSFGVLASDSAALDIVGDIDIRFEATLDNWQAAGSVELCGKGEVTGNQRSWIVMARDGNLHFEWSTDGVTAVERDSTQPLPVPASGQLAVRVTFDVDNGATGNTTTFYTAPTIEGPWVQLGEPITGAGVTSLFNSTSGVRVGQGWSTLSFASASGKVHAFELRNGIGGTLVAAPHFAETTAGATAFVDSVGLSWSVRSGSSLSDRWQRFNLAIPEWPPSWHVSGHNVSARLAAAGTLRRLGQGRKALDSTLRRRIPSFGPLAYWPMEDESGSTAAASPIAGVQPMDTQNMDFGANDTLAGSKALAVVDRSSGACLMQGKVPAPSSALSSWGVVWMYYLEQPNTTLYTFMRIQSTGTVREWYIQTRNDLTRVFGLDSDGATVFTEDIATDTTLFGQWMRVDFTATQSGGNVEWHIAWVPVEGDGVGVTLSFAGTVGTPTAVGSPLGGFGTELDGMAIGHVSVWPTSSSSVGPLALFSAADAWTGETAGERISRLSDEESLPIAVAGTTDLQQRMGPQLPATLLELLEECEATDGGILYEDRESTGLRYRDRASLYNQTPRLTIPYGQLAPPLTPVDDDQAIRNDVTRQRIGGSSARVVVEDGPLSVLPPEEGGVGIYDESLSLSMYDDTQPLQIAAWAAHLGTWDEARYPSVRLYLHKYPALISDVLLLDVGDVIRITDLPDHLPPGPVDLMVMGYQEEIGPLAWDLTLFCAPAGPWSVAVADTARADTSGTELAAAVDADDTVLPLVTTSGPEWIDSATYADQFPFDVRVGGEVVTVTACTGVAEDAFGRTVASGWGTSDSGQAWATSGGAAADYAVSSGTGRHIMNTRGLFRVTTVPVPVSDVDLRFDFSLSAVPAGDAAYVYAPVRYIDETHMYFARVQVSAGGAFSLSLRKRNGSETLLTSVAPGITLTAGTWYTLRVAMTGSTLNAKVWLRSGTEPSSWQLSATDTDMTAAGSVGARTFLGATTTNPLPVTVQFDNLRAGPQQFTVTRSVNGIVKSHAAGTAVRLAYPSYVAL